MTTIEYIFLEIVVQQHVTMLFGRIEESACLKPQTLKKIPVNVAGAQELVIRMSLKPNISSKQSTIMCCCP